MSSIVSAIAARLRRLGLQTDAVIGIQLPNTAECVLTILGVIRAGMIAAPLPLLWRRADMTQGARPKSRRGGRSRSEVTKYRSATGSVSAVSSTPAECNSCKSGLDQYCTAMVLTYNAIGRDGAQPLAATARPSWSTRTTCCASRTTFRWRRPRRRSAPVSRCTHRCGTGTPARASGSRSSASAASAIGVKLAAAMGAEVTVLSQSLKKMDDGLRLGANHYYATSDPDTFNTLAGTFDLILNTVSANLDIAAFLSLLTVDATLVEIGLPEHPMPLPVFALAAMRRNLSASLFGGTNETQNARLLRRARYSPGDRADRRGLHQRGLRARTEQRCAVPLRHRHGDSVNGWCTTLLGQSWEG